MLNVLTGFAVVFIVIAVGYVLAWRKVLGGDGRRALASFVYAVATPALLFTQLTTTDPEKIFNAGFAVVALSALLTGFLFFLVCRFVFKDRLDESLIGMLAASYANGGNLGIPLAAALLGDVSAVIPVMLFQVAFYAPVTLTILDSMRSTHSTWVQNLIVVPLTNPMLIASIAGIIMVALPVQVPTVIAEPTAMLGGASVPLALVVFGMSLYGSRLRVDKHVASAVVFKNFVHPLIAGLLAAGVFGLSGYQLFVAIFLGALPTAQNVNTYAIRFRVKEDLARDAGVVTTLTSIPVLIAITVIFGP